MRVLRLSCFILILLNVAVFGLGLFPRSIQGLKAIVPVKHAGAVIEKSTGVAVVFREYSDVVLSSVAPAGNRENLNGSPYVLPAEIIDKENLIYLGQMKGNDAHNALFFKDKRTNRVYSTGNPRDLIKVISQSDSSFLVEIDGTKYEALR